MERIVNYHIVWFLEKNKLFAIDQSSFRKQRDPLDHLACFETFSLKEFCKKGTCCSKHFDTTWKYGIINDLRDFGIKAFLAFLSFLQ